MDNPDPGDNDGLFDLHAHRQPADILHNLQLHLDTINALLDAGDIVPPHLLADYVPPALPADPLSPPERAQRRSPENPDSALSRTAKRQDTQTGKDSSDAVAAARAAFTFITSERTLGDWRISLVDLTSANASMLIALLLKLFARISPLPFFARMRMMDLLKQPLSTTTSRALQADIERLEAVNTLVQSIPTYCLRLLALAKHYAGAEVLNEVLAVLDRILLLPGQVIANRATVAGKLPRSACIRLLTRFFELALPGLTTGIVGLTGYSDEQSRQVLEKALRTEYENALSELPLPPELVEKYTKVASAVATDLLAALGTYPTDCTFTLAGGATMSAHRVILRQRCSSLLAQSHYPSVPLPVFQLIIKYLYADVLAVPSAIDPTMRAILADVVSYGHVLGLPRLIALADSLLGSRRSEVPDSTLDEDLNAILANRAAAAASEIVLLVPTNGPPQPAHRLFLCARSPYFSALHSFNSSANDLAPTTIPLNFASSELDIVLSYVYTDKAVFALATLCELYAAADTLLLHGLRDRAVQFLEKHISIDGCVGVCNRAYVMGLSGLAEFCFGYLLKHLRSVVAERQADFALLQDNILPVFLAHMFNYQIEEESVRCNDLQMNILRVILTNVLRRLRTNPSAAIPFPRVFSDLVTFALSDYVTLYDLALLLLENEVYKELALVSVFVSLGVVFADLDVREAIDESFALSSHHCVHCGSFRLIRDGRRRFERASGSEQNGEACPCHANVPANATPASLCSGCQHAQLLAIADMWHRKTINELRSTIPIPTLTE